MEHPIVWPNLRALLLALVFWGNALGAQINVPTRPGVTVDIFWAPIKNAKATLLLMPGGDGGYGSIKGDYPTGNNFLVRAAPGFAANGFNVAIFGESSDVGALGYEERISKQHALDINVVIDHLRRIDPAPVWIVGTSRGTVSAVIAAIARKEPGIAGLVLSSSVTKAGHPGAVQEQELSDIGIPVLLIHHVKDECKVCPPSGVALIAAGLVNAPIKKVVMVDGGSGPTGNPCAARHWHGFIGMEQEVVDLISKWITAPTAD
jgi:predicted alpha/beta-hydrolase family hydrolase